MVTNRILSITIAIMLSLGTAGMAQADSEEIAELRAMIAAQQQQLILMQEKLDSISANVAENSNKAAEANQKTEILAENLEEQAEDRKPVSRTSIGGYGELHANLLDGTNTEDKNSIDFHRFVLFFGHEFNDRLRFFSEVEVEHALSGDGKPGEVEIEQAYIEYDLNQNNQFRAGLFLVPVGIINETHEPNTFYGVERNPIEKNIIPSTWWEGGVSVNGSFADGISYDFAATSGLNTSAESGYAIRKGRQKVAKAEFNSGAYTGRLRWLGLPGLELGLTAQYQVDITQENDPTAGGATLMETHLSWQTDTFSLRALYASWSLDGTGPAAIGADQQTGWDIEPNWRFNPQWGIFARYNAWDNQAGDRLDSEYTQWDAGVNFWLHPNVVFKLDYQSQNAPVGTKSYDGWNIGVGYQF